MKMDKILLTMGMPVYNEEKYIGEAIESLLAQTYKNFILIISDNASTDRTPQICRYYAKKDKRIVYVRHEKNRGSLFNFRYLLEQAKTPFFMWCSGHDKWHPYFVEKLIPALEKGDVILSYPRTKRINTEGMIGEEIYEEDCTTVDINNPRDRYLYILRIMRKVNIIYGIWRTQALKKCNFNLKTFAADHIIVAQAAFEGKFKRCNEFLFFLRERRKDFGFIHRIHGAFSRLTGESNKKISTPSFIISFISDNKKVLSRKRYSFGIATKIWFMINIAYLCLFWFCLVPAFISIFKKLFSEKNYFRIKSIWKKWRYQKP